MFKAQIYKKGIHKAPDYLEIEILLHASQKIRKEEDEYYLSWLPLAGYFLLLRDYLQGYRLKFRPMIKL